MKERKREKVRERDDDQILGLREPEARRRLA
jgi:hypothetical protein